MKNMPSRASEGERRGEQGERGNDDRGGDEKKNSTTTCRTTRLEKAAGGGGGEDRAPEDQVEVEHGGLRCSAFDRSRS